jgi:hypothetical protein
MKIINGQFRNKNKNEYPQTAVICENSEFLIGIRKYVRMDRDWSSVYYTPCIYGKNGKKFYKDIIEDLILNNNLFDIPIFHNRYTYYDPFNDYYNTNHSLKPYLKIHAKTHKPKLFA